MCDRRSVSPRITISQSICRPLGKIYLGGMELGVIMDVSILVICLFVCLLFYLIIVRLIFVIK